MECNRDEAMRAKSMAEIHMKANDFCSAAKFASLAQKLDPKIDGVSKMVSIIDVYLSAERKVGGEVDWYGILRVNPTADDEAINKQYKRLALETHPDKNSTVGAAGAFKLVSEAKCLLLDKARRTAYDRIAGYEPSPTKFTYVPFEQKMQDVPDFVFTQKRTKVQVKKPKKVVQTNPTSDLFWTVCYRCRLQLQYRVMFRNIVIKCLRCEKTFMAVEVPWPVGRSRSHKPKPWPPCREEAQSAGEGLKRRREWPDPSAVPAPFGPGNFEAGNFSGQNSSSTHFGPGNFEAGNFSGQNSSSPPFGAGNFEAGNFSGQNSSSPPFGAANFEAGNFSGQNSSSPPFGVGNFEAGNSQQAGRVPFGPGNFEAGSSFGVAYQQPFGQDNFVGVNPSSGAAFWNSSGMQQGQPNPYEVGKEAEMEGWGMEEDNRVGGNIDVKNFYACW